MFRTDFIFRKQKKSSLNQDVRRDYATMQQDDLLYFCLIWFYWNEAQIWRNDSIVQL